MIKEFIMNLVWGHVFMPKAKKQAIKDIKELSEALSKEDAVFKYYYETALKKERREARETLRWVAVISFRAAAIILLALMLSWQIPKILSGDFFWPLLWVIISIGAAGLFMACSCSHMAAIHEIYLGAKTEALKKLEEYHDAEAASKKVAQGRTKVKTSDTAAFYQQLRRQRAGRNP